jgi:hypothetical protein
MHFAVESIYSLAQITTPGSLMDHMDVIRMLAGLWRDAGQMDQIPNLVADYLRRDLLNKILGNSDNHGRKTAIIRDTTSFRLAPIYAWHRWQWTTRVSHEPPSGQKSWRERVMLIGEEYVEHWLTSPIRMIRWPH